MKCVLIYYWFVLIVLNNEYIYWILINEGYEVEVFISCWVKLVFVKSNKLKIF